MHLRRVCLAASQLEAGDAPASSARPPSPAIAMGVAQLERALLIGADRFLEVVLPTRVAGAHGAREVCILGRARKLVLRARPDGFALRGAWVQLLEKGA